MDRSWLRACLVLLCGAAAGAADGERARAPDWLYPLEPIYFLLDTGLCDGHDDAKFQFSVSAQVVGQETSPKDGSDRPMGLYASYTQTSFWDLQSVSKPFYDNSYRPELWWHQDGLPHAFLGCAGLDLQGGFGHESNGQSGDLSRSANRLWLRPVARWNLGSGWDLRLRPRVFTYIGSLEDNPDLPAYRGYVELDADAGQADGWRFATQARIGSGGDRGSIQGDLSYPLSAITRGWVHTFIYAQVFSGYAETLRSYRDSDTRVLVGIGLWR